MINQIKNILCGRTAERLTFLKCFIDPLISFPCIVHMKTEIQINQENISTREAVNHIAFFTFYLNYTNFPNVHKDG